MVFSQKFERRFGWLSFPGLLRYYAIMQVLASVVMMLNPGLYSQLCFNWVEMFRHHQWWRLVTCLYCTPYLSLESPMTLVYLFFMVAINFMVSDALEAAWGVFKTSLFGYCGMIGCVLANAILPQGGGLVMQGAFFAFATLFPTAELRFYYAFPVQVRFIAWVNAAVLVFPLFGLGASSGWLGAGLYAAYLILGLCNYVLWAGIPGLRNIIRRSFKLRRLTRNLQTYAEGRHCCAVCKRTDASHPDLEFRVGPDGQDYCIDHVPNGT